MLCWEAEQGALVLEGFQQTRTLSHPHTSPHTRLHTGTYSQAAVWLDGG